VTRTPSTIRLSGQVVRLIVAGFVSPILDTLPASEEEAGWFLAGFTWAFGVFIVLLLLVTLAWAKAHGIPTMGPLPHGVAP
jgi:hypothetical protein